MKQWILVLAMVGSLQVGLAGEGEAPANEKMERWAEAVSDQMRGWVNSRLATERQPATALTQNMRLTFELTPKDKKEEALSIVTATSEFGIEVSKHQEGPGGIEVNVEGTLEEYDSDHTQMSYSFHMHLGEGEGETGIHLRGSAYVAHGKMVELAQVGDRKLMVRIDPLPTN